MGGESWGVGDVFTLPTGDRRVGIGQIAAEVGPNLYFFTIFDLVMPEGSDLDLDALATVDVLYVARSNDTKLEHGHWVVVGHAPTRPAGDLPGHRVYVSDTEVFVEDHAGSRRRPATLLEDATVANKFSVAPGRLEKALRAHLGLEPWHKNYDALLPANQISSDELFPPDPT